MSTSRMPKNPTMTVFCLLVVLVCLYGLLASFEPGTNVGWKIAYILGALIFAGLFVKSLVQK